MLALGGGPLALERDLDRMDGFKWLVVVGALGRLDLVDGEAVRDVRRRRVDRHGAGGRVELGDVVDLGRAVRRLPLPAVAPVGTLDLGVVEEAAKSRPNSVQTKSRYFAGFCGLKHVPCMSNLLGIFVLGHCGALYTQNDENDVIFFLNAQFNHRAHASGTLVV